MEKKKSFIRGISLTLVLILAFTTNFAVVLAGTENFSQENAQLRTDSAAVDPASNEMGEQICAADQNLPADIRKTEQEVIAAARLGLTRFLRLIRKGSESSFGFQDRTELEQAGIGNMAYQMYTRCQGTDYPTTVWRVPVIAASKTRVFLIVDWVDDRWQVVALGGTEFADSVSKLDNEIVARKSVQDQTELHRIIIRDHRKRSDFLLLRPYSQDKQFKQAILDFPEVIQEQNQWCWAGVSVSIFDYFDNSVEQCEVAEYTRTVATWHDFGPTDCCANPGGDCNYWNYNYGYDGSIEDILENMQERVQITNYGVSRALTVAEVEGDLGNDLPFVIRWAWDGGGGHFIVGFGVDDNLSDSSNPYLHYMDPWFGEGNHIALYFWVSSGGGHTWTHTNRLTSVTTSGDIDGNKHLELSDVIIALQLITDTPTVSPLISADVNDDFKIGLAEALYLLQHLAESQDELTK